MTNCKLYGSECSGTHKVHSDCDSELQIDVGTVCASSARNHLTGTSCAIHVMRARNI